MLDEVHFSTQSAFPYDKVPGLKDLEVQLGQDHSHKVRVGIGEQRHVGHQPTTVETHDLLMRSRGKGS